MKTEIADKIKECIHAVTEKTEFFSQFGAYLIFATAHGDSWLIEIETTDCLSLTAKGFLLFDQSDHQSGILWDGRCEIDGDAFIFVTYTGAWTSLSRYPIGKLKEWLE